MEVLSLEGLDSKVAKDEITFTPDQLEKLVLSPEAIFLLLGSGLATFGEEGELVSISPHAGNPNKYPPGIKGYSFSAVEVLANYLQDVLNFRAPRD